MERTNVSSAKDHNTDTRGDQDEKAVIKQIDSTTWQFTEKFLGENVYCYLLVGNEKALLIDTAYGFQILPVLSGN